MKSITRITTLGLPTIIGLGLAWVGLRIMSNERRLETREMELQLQLDAKAIKNL